MEKDPTPIHPDRLGNERASGSGQGAGGVAAKISSNREIAIVQADYLALANDLEQAQALSSSLEMELSGKTNELARFKLIWERTQADLAKFERDIEVLRKERHTLANEAQRGRAFELKYERAQAALDELTAKVERLEAELVREREAHVRTRAQLDARPKGSPLRDDPAWRESLEALRAQIDRVLAREPVPTAAQPRVEHIDIEFTT